MSDPDDPSLWRNLSHYEVLAADFEAAGADWDAVLPSEFAEPIPDWLRAEFPDSGWRVITVRHRHHPPSPDTVFAAPKDRGWAIGSVRSQPNGLPTFVANHGSYQLRPTEALRRQGLQLTWEEPLRVAASDLNDVTVTLTNTSTQTWKPDDEEHGFVHGHILDEQGQSPANCFFGYGRYQGELKDVSLEPGESMQLPVSFGHDGEPEPGTYSIEAIMVSFNLRSPTGTLEIVLDTDLPPTGDANHEALRQRLATLRALQKAIREPQTVVAIAAESDSDGDFVLSLMAALNIDLAQAVVIADMQIRRLFKVERDQLQSDIRALRKQLKPSTPPQHRVLPPGM